MAAFVGGLAFGATAGRGEEREVYYVEQTGSLASAVAWLLFGALAVPIIGADLLAVEVEGDGATLGEPTAVVRELGPTTGGRSDRLTAFGTRYAANTGRQ